MLTRAQFAQAARADEKWVENTARATRRSLSYSPAEVRWFGIVRVLTRDFAISVRRASELADTALRSPATARDVIVAESRDGTARLTMDLAREYSSASAALSAALHHGGPQARGRRRAARRVTAGKAIGEAERYGADLALLEESLALTPGQRLARLDANAAFVRAMQTTRSR
jgi:hypothetical protein